MRQGTAASQPVRVNLVGKRPSLVCRACHAYAIDKLELPNPSASVNADVCRYTQTHSSTTIAMAFMRRADMRASSKRPAIMISRKARPLSACGRGR